MHSVSKYIDFNYYVSGAMSLDLSACRFNTFYMSKALYILQRTSAGAECTQWRHEAVSPTDHWLTYRHPQVYVLSRQSAVFMDEPSLVTHTQSHTHTHTRMHAATHRCMYAPTHTHRFTVHWCALCCDPLLLNECTRWWTGDVVLGRTIDVSLIR